MRLRRKVLCVTWAPSSPRLDEIAAEVGGERWDCSVLFKVMVLAPFRYLLMTAKTFQKLSREKPRVLITQNPPVFLPLIGWFYCKLANCKLIVDHHCVWSIKTIYYPILHQIIKSLEAFVARRAKLNTAPHDVWTSMLKSFGRVKAATVIDFVGVVDAKEPHKSFRKTKYLAVYPGGSGAAERPDLAVKAVQELDDVTLYITGKREYLGKVLKYEGRKVFFSGFLPREEYYGILKASDIVLNLSEEPFTIPHFIYEALAIGKPVISSPDKAVKATFNGYLYILESTDVNDVKTGIMNVLQNSAMWAEKARLLQEKLKEKRERQMRILRSEVEA